MNIIIQFNFLFTVTVIFVYSCTEAILSVFACGWPRRKWMAI